MLVHSRWQWTRQAVLLALFAIPLVACGSPTDAKQPPLKRNGQIAFSDDHSGAYTVSVVNPDGSNPSTVAANAYGDADYGVWSPDGTRLAVEMAGYGGSSTFAIDVLDIRDGQSTNRRSVATNGAHGPAWSPDGNRLAFMCDSAGVTDICVVSSVGGSVTNLTHNGAHNYDPTWSPDGGRIALMSDQDGEQAIYVMEVSGANLRRVTQNPAGDVGPAWSPTSDVIAFISRQNGGYALRIVNADGSGERTITDKVGSIASPVWSPDGKRLAFITRPSGISQIAVVGADGTGYTRLTSLTAGASEPAWSPDATKIAFISDDDLFVMDADGTHPIDITQTPGVADHAPSWGALPSP